MGKIQILNKLPTKNPATIPFDAASNSFFRILEARNEYKKIAAQEKTKREVIGAWRDVRLAELKNQQEILRLYLENTFKERRKMIDGLLEALDKGMEAGNIHVIDTAINGIVSIAKDSPLKQVDNLIAALKNDNVKVIDF
ncbi:hypothetical protein [Neisseria meningitidis]|uniref:hypothetical protein n=1 Tax=Neisseria meningitidis TaxID=487 RepID=UPI000E58906E|nr:hypothetical protein [Neisseria meningitidis]